MKVKSHKHAKIYAEAAIHIVAEELKKVPDGANIVKQAWAVSGETYKKALDLANINGNLKEIEETINLADNQADEAREIASESLISIPPKDMEQTISSSNLMLYVGIGAVGLAGVLLLSMLMRGRRKAVTANTDDRVIRRTRELYKKYGAPCNCGGPQYGTDHSPDCETIISWDHLRDWAESEIYDEELKKDEELEKRLHRTLEHIRR